ncbi:MULTISPECIES: E3 binding domain-containing protein [unclassified Streptomyces]|uniref:E3 binding domain-containing protein n=1 Tax=unclassified Streptomyces TaxID=2593676 RepID=UPI00386A27C4
MHQGRSAQCVPEGADSAEATSAIGAGPLVRHLALRRGIDLTAVHGTGRGGRITRADVERASPTPAPRGRATPYARRLAQGLGRTGPARRREPRHRADPFGLPSIGRDHSRRSTTLRAPVVVPRANTS